MARVPYIRGMMVHPFIGGMNPYIGGMVHRSEDGPYTGAPYMFEHAFRHLATFICSLLFVLYNNVFSFPKRAELDDSL